MTNCNLTYRLHLDLAPNDTLKVETSPDTLSRVWSAVQTFSDPGGVSTAGQYPLETVAPVSVDGSKFHLRFHLTSNGTGTDDGTYVDDVQVKCGTNAPIFGPDHFSSTLTGWTTGGSPQPLWGIATVAGDWAFMSGTSMATPFVTGAAALLWAKYPSASVTSVKDAILRSADDLPAFATTTFSGGRLNAQHALQMIDVTPPTGVGFTGTGIASAYQLAPSFGLGWTATDSGTGVKSFDVRYERAPYNGGFGPWTTWRSGVTSSGGTFGSAPGYSYCFEVRARDNVLNTSAWSAPRCTNFPVNDTQLKASSGWSRVKSATRYLGDDTYSATKGATLTLANADWRRMDLVVSVCKGCGSVAVYSGSTYLGTFSTNAPSFGTRRLVFVRSSGHVNGPATITIRVVSPSDTRS